MLPIVIPAGLFSIVVFSVTVAIATRKRRAKRKEINLEMLTRRREFDAIVCFSFDADNDYVINTIQPELEENHDPPFKLCVHSRDFEVGVDIKDNIQNSIENSNSAIIIMSQDFVDSVWCKEEFADCYRETMKDPAFRLLVIMMQPPETLENVSNYMSCFFESKTYLEKDDPMLLHKIVDHLTRIKEAKPYADAGDNNEEEQLEVEIL